MSGNLAQIWARWPYPVQESSWCIVGFIAYRVVAELFGFVPT